MNITPDNILLVGSILLIISLVAGKTSYKFGVPVLVFFLAIGMLAGSEGIGGIYFDNPKTTQFIGIVALNIILFSGGFDTNWQSIKPILWQGIVLSSLGVLITAVAVGLFVWQFASFSIYEGLLLGAIVSSTDSAAVFSILRSKSLKLKYNLRPTLELESGSNDPMAYVLTIAFTSLVVSQDAGLLSKVPMLLQQILLGGLLGYLFGRAGKYAINYIRLEYEGLYFVLVLAIIFFTFSATDFVGGNGFLAVYLCAVYLGNQDLIHKKQIHKSFDGFAWLMQILLFLTLGLLVFPSQVIPVIGVGLIISAFLILAARPISVMISLLPFKLNIRSRLFISWVGLRGAVPIVFATYPLIAGADKAQMIFNIVFFISLTSVVLQGTTLPVFARWLNVSIKDEPQPWTQTDIDLNDNASSILTEITLPDQSKAIGRPLVTLGLPRTALISIIQRNSRFITPNGSTTLESGDKLFILSEEKDIMGKVFDCLDIKRNE